MKMTANDVVAALRPRPSGPPLRGRAPLHDAIIQARPIRRAKMKKMERGFHLKFFDQWFEFGGRRRRYAVPSMLWFADLISPLVVPLSNMLLSLKSCVHEASTESNRFPKGIVVNLPFEVPCRILYG